MKRKIISLLLVTALIGATALVFSGCGDNKDFPVDVANFTVEKKPENIVVLDPNAADIIAFEGYDVKMAGRSDEVNQDYLSVVPSVGSKATPDVGKITQSGATLVFADNTISDETKTALNKSNVQVIQMESAQTTNELETNYKTIGKIMGGKETGANNGETSYKKLLDSLDKIKTSVKEFNSSTETGNILDTVCYLYLENGTLKMMTNSTYGDLLIGYTGAVNAAVNVESNEVDVNVLKVANPNYIFYSDDATLQFIKSEKTLKTLNAVKKNSMMMVSLDELSRQGQTAINTLTNMVNFMYPNYAKQNASATQPAATAQNTNSKTQTATIVAPTTATTLATTPTTTPATTAPASLAKKYKITYTDKTVLKNEDDNSNVKAMQQRLYDLGYITDKENVTGYFGDVTKAAVNAFQKDNAIAQTGKADSKTLNALFDANAKKAQ